MRPSSINLKMLEHGPNTQMHYFRQTDLTKLCNSSSVPASYGSCRFYLTEGQSDELNDAFVAIGAKMETTAEGLRLTSKEAALMKLIKTSLAGKS
jgi:hypothetical protein